MPRADRHAQRNAEGVWSIPISTIDPNPHQPRQSFDEEALNALAASIRQVGLLQPVAVRAVGIARYELIAGERRLRACEKLGMTHINALVLPATENHSALLALVENLQREDLHYLDEAEGYLEVLRTCAMTQEALAERIGLSQSAVANKLRLLKLDPPVRAALRACGLTERHARALLKLPLSTLQMDAVRRMDSQHLTVKQAEVLVKDMLTALPPKRSSRRILSLIRDHRLYINAIRDIARQMQAAGLQAQTEVNETDEELTITVRVFRGAKAGKARAQASGS